MNEASGKAVTGGLEKSGKSDGSFMKVDLPLYWDQSARRLWD